MTSTPTSSAAAAPFTIDPRKPTLTTLDTLTALANLYGDTTTDRPAVAYVVVSSSSGTTDDDTTAAYLPDSALFARVYDTEPVWVACVPRQWAQWTVDRFGSGLIAATLAIDLDSAIKLGGERIFDRR